jgi:hypothetical protein
VWFILTGGIHIHACVFVRSDVDLITLTYTSVLVCCFIQFFFFVEVIDMHQSMIIFSLFPSADLLVCTFLV